MIRKIDRLILKDIVPPWLFGVGLLASLLMAATYFGRIAGFIVDGVPPLVVLELTGLLFPPILTKTFTIAVLLATLLGFGRLSADSEIVALRAAGSSMYRVIAPVLVFSTFMAGATFAFDEKFVPLASTQYLRITDDLAHHVKLKDPLPGTFQVVQNKQLRLAIVAQNVDPATQTLRGVIVHSYDEKGQAGFEMRADLLEFHQDLFSTLTTPGADTRKLLYSWRASGHVRLISPDFSSVVSVRDGVWPTQLQKIDEDFKEVTEPKDSDFDRYTFSQLRQFIAFHGRRRDITDKMLHNYEYGYWGKIAIPLAAVMFGVLGTVLGIRNHRGSASAGYGIAIGITFLFVLLGNVMSIWAQGGVIPAWVAAFTPIVLGSIVSGVILWRRNG